MKKQDLTILLSLGLLSIGLTQIISHYLVLPDLINGLFIGVGIGLMIISLLFRQHKGFS